MQRLANNENGGLLTVGIAGALWSSSAAIVSIVGALNRAYDIKEGRPWWKVRLVAIGLTLGVAVIVLSALSLVLVGPSVAEYLGERPGGARRSSGRGWSCSGRSSSAWWRWGSDWSTTSAPTPSRTGSGLRPARSSPRSCGCWSRLSSSLYIANFTDYDGSYGTVGGVIVLLLWFYVSGVAILAAPS